MDAGYGREIQPLPPLFSDCIGNRSPDLILKFDRRRARYRHRGTDTFLARLDQPQHPDFAVGVIEVAAAVVARHGRADARHLIFGIDHTRGFQIAREQRALGVDIRADMVGDGSGVFADANAAIEGRVAEPYRPPFLALVQHLPEADMIAMIGALADRFFERQIFAPAEVIKVADWRILVLAVEQYAADDFDR